MFNAPCALKHDEHAVAVSKHQKTYRGSVLCESGRNGAGKRFHGDDCHGAKTAIDGLVATRNNPLRRSVRPSVDARAELPAVELRRSADVSAMPLAAGAGHVPAAHDGQCSKTVAGGRSWLAPCMTVPVRRRLNCAAHRSVGTARPSWQRPCRSRRVLGNFHRERRVNFASGQSPPSPKPGHYSGRDRGRLRPFSW